MKAAVIGHPIAHSKSPVIHQYWLNKYQVGGSYDAIDIHPDNLEAEIQKLIAEGYTGFNVTVPHKQNIMKLCHKIDKTALTIGAVNTVVIKEGKLLGYNTDAFGFIENIKQNSNFSFQGKTVCVLGAGGAARAVVYGLIQESVSKIFITNRTFEKAQELTKIAPEITECVHWEERSDILDNIDLLVNTTSLGMTGKKPLELELMPLAPHAIVHDIVYAPLMTDLLFNAQKLGNPIVTGIGMLLHQARPAFHAWTGTMPDINSELESLVLS